MLLLVAAGASAQPLSSDDQKCLNALHAGAVKVAGAQGTLVAGCIKAAAKGAEPFPQVCLGVDERGKVAKAQEKLSTAEAKKCAVAPPFGAAAEDAGAAAVGAVVGLTADVFGDNLNLAVVETLDSKDGAKCQAAVWKEVLKVLTTEAKFYLRCLKNGLKGEVDPIVSAEGQVRCLDALAADELGKVSKAGAKLARTVERKCAEIGPDWAFPGTCGAASELSRCLLERVSCRLCGVLETAGAYDADCDGFDDGAVNSSCE